MMLPANGSRTYWPFGNCCVMAGSKMVPVGKVRPEASVRDPV